MSDNLTIIVAPLRDLLTAGVPKWHVLDLASKHLEAVKKLDESTENKQETISILESLIKELEA